MALSDLFKAKRWSRRLEYWRRRIFGPRVSSWADLESFARIAGSVPACFDRLMRLGYEYVADGPDDSYAHPLCFLNDLRGDCEDTSSFLLECAHVLGVDARLVIVEYALDGPLSPLPIAHAVCAFREGENWKHCSNWGTSPYSRLTIEALVKVTVLDPDVIPAEGQGFCFPHFRRAVVLDASLSIESEILA